MYRSYEPRRLPASGALERAGLIERRALAQDRRRQALALSARGAGRDALQRDLVASASS
jgi:hypothetical protein